MHPFSSEKKVAWPKTIMMMMSRWSILLIFGSVIGYSCGWSARLRDVQGQRRVSSSIRVGSAPLFATTSSSSNIPYPRAAVSVAVRCEHENEVYYLLVQRGKDPNQGRWSFPGGKMEIGETAVEGGKRELLEETQFAEQDQLQWHHETIATQDSIMVTKDGAAAYHFLIAICFAELKHVKSLPNVKASDDAADAQWWRMADLVAQGIDVTPGLVERIDHTEFLYQREVLL